MRDRFFLVGLGLSVLRATSAVSVVSDGVEYFGKISDETTSQEAFLGIPYAHAARFERPTAPSVSSPFNASTYGDFCPQLWDIEGAVQSENCLSVNIWRPVGTTSQSALPVMVFIYGGSFTHGIAAGYPMSGFGEVAASQGKPIIGVNFNYRTGVYGFPVGARAKQNNALNLGLYDQRAALEWVQSHIADFGGSPAKVTLFGHSAGGVSVGLQMLYNGGSLGGAFQRGIMESGSPNSIGTQPASTPARETAYNYLVNNTGCNTATDTFTCLKSANFAEFNAAHIAVYDYMRDYIVPDYPWSVFAPVVSDGDSFLPVSPYKAIVKGRFAKIPFISGTALDEGTLFVPVPETKQDTVDFLTLAVPGSDLGYSDDVPAITKLVNNVYSDDPADGSPYGTGDEIFGTSPYWKQATSITGDLIFEAPRRFFLRKAVQAGVNVWSYRWMQHVGLADIFPPSVGISHAQEIYAEFRNPAVTPEGLAVGAVFIDYLSAFAYAGSGITPATSGLPVWKKYNQGAKNLQFRYNDYQMLPDSYRSTEINTIISTILPAN